MRKLSAVAALLVMAPAFGKTLEITNNACGADPDCRRAFISVSEDLVATVDYKGLGPAEATGIVGFGVGVVGTYVPVEVESDWQTVTGQSFSGLGLVGLQVTKGLPLGLDVGAFYTRITGTDVEVYGGEIRYAILEGSAASPALSLRGSFVEVTGIDSFDLKSQAVDISLSKGITFVTPYVGAGYVFGESDPHGTAGLEKAEVEDSKAYIGARFSLGLFELTPEVGQTGDTVTYSLRTGFSFAL